MKPPCLVWFREDLRLSDNPALTAAKESGAPIIPVFIWDREKAPWQEGSASKAWLHHSLLSLEKSLQKRGCPLLIQTGDPLSVISHIMKKTGAKSVFWNRLYEPYFIKRDAEIEKKCKQEGYHVETFQASLWFGPEEILSKDGKPYRVFTPFWKACQKSFPLDPPLPAPKKLTSYSGSVSGVSIEKLHLLPKIHWEKSFFPFWKIGEDNAKAKLD
ncbi:MAG: deoxyribodipyrimidine photo-lyase, partial [Chlamydiae bacterium]|nr:deoxyribodipyrimidine photo-lyase [Chlamydiota bacterium]